MVNFLGKVFVESWAAFFATEVVGVKTKVNTNHCTGHTHTHTYTRECCICMSGSGKVVQLQTDWGDLTVSCRIIRNRLSWQRKKIKEVGTVNLRS